MRIGRGSESRVGRVRSDILLIFFVSYWNLRATFLGKGVCMFLRFCIMILKGCVLRYHKRLSKACELDVCSSSCTFWVLFYTMILEMQH